ncbi:hypothetical protein [Ornithinibacillus halotolerans]|uniref:Uncharacterized protein n=1 Tax=Ornithinibacillus halotolerans TaxID=1274357 RepID=A0A916WFS0_9BACI|nr:hypothetical protein [Ornithinibacillus halotolerans]GGA93202.1 hypothetical protein GCM10008025_39470 [Ornithinibacillus halotolerans]
MKKVFVLCLVFLVFSFITVTTVLAEESQQNSLSNMSLIEKSEKVEESKKFREEFGLNMNNEHILEVLLSKNSSYKYGVALTMEEEKEIDRRVYNQQNIIPLIKEYIH